MSDFLSSPSRNLILAGVLAFVLLGGLTGLVMMGGGDAEKTPIDPMVAFEKICGAPADVGRGIPDECKTLAAINARFGMDLLAEIEKNHIRMVATARRIQSGELSDPDIYNACVRDGTCAAVPLLPSDVDASTIDAQSTEYLNIRTAFWGLVEDRALGREVCTYIRPCDIAMKTGALHFESVAPQLQPSTPTGAGEIILNDGAE